MLERLNILKYMFCLIIVSSWVRRPKHLNSKSVAKNCKVTQTKRRLRKNEQSQIIDWYWRVFGTCFVLLKINYELFQSCNVANKPKNAGVGNVILIVKTKLKQAPVIASISTTPGWNKNVQLQLDTFSFSKRVMLARKVNNKTKRVVPYASKQLSKAKSLNR